MVACPGMLAVARCNCSGLPTYGDSLDLSWMVSLREVIIYRPRDIGLEFFYLVDLSPQNSLRPIHGAAYTRRFTVVPVLLDVTGHTARKTIMTALITPRVLFPLLNYMMGKPFVCTLYDTPEPGIQWTYSIPGPHRVICCVVVGISLRRYLKITKLKRTSFLSMILLRAR